MNKVDQLISYINSTDKENVWGVAEEAWAINSDIVTKASCEMIEQLENCFNIKFMLFLNTVLDKIQNNLVEKVTNIYIKYFDDVSKQKFLLRHIIRISKNNELIANAIDRFGETELIINIGEKNHDNLMNETVIRSLIFSVIKGTRGGIYYFDSEPSHFKQYALKILEVAKTFGKEELRNIEVSQNMVNSSQEDYRFSSESIPLIFVSIIGVLLYKKFELSDMLPKHDGYRRIEYVEQIPQTPDALYALGRGIVWHIDDWDRLLEILSTSNIASRQMRYEIMAKNTELSVPQRFEKSESITKNNIFKFRNIVPDDIKNPSALFATMKECGHNSWTDMELMLDYFIDKQIFRIKDVIETVSSETDKNFIDYIVSHVTKDANEILMEWLQETEFKFLGTNILDQIQDDKFDSFCFNAVLSHINKIKSDDRVTNIHLFINSKIGKFIRRLIDLTTIDGKFTDKTKQLLRDLILEGNVSYFVKGFQDALNKTQTTFERGDANVVYYLSGVSLFMNPSSDWYSKNTLSNIEIALTVITDNPDTKYHFDGKNNLYPFIYIEKYTHKAIDILDKFKIDLQWLYMEVENIHSKKYYKYLLSKKWFIKEGIRYTSWVAKLWTFSKDKKNTLKNIDFVRDIVMNNDIVIKHYDIQDVMKFLIDCKYPEDKILSIINNIPDVKPEELNKQMRVARDEKDYVLQFLSGVERKKRDVALKSLEKSGLLNSALILLIDKK